MHLSKPWIKESTAEIEINPVCVANAFEMDDLLSIQNPGYQWFKTTDSVRHFQRNRFKNKKEKAPFICS